MDVPLQGLRASRRSRRSRGDSLGPHAYRRTPSRGLRRPPDQHIVTGVSAAFKGQRNVFPRGQHRLRRRHRAPGPPEAPGIPPSRGQHSSVNGGTRDPEDPEGHALNGGPNLREGHDCSPARSPPDTARPRGAAHPLETPPPSHLLACSRGLGLAQLPHVPNPHPSSWDEAATEHARVQA